MKKKTIIWASLIVVAVAASVFVYFAVNKETEIKIEPNSVIVYENANDEEKSDPIIKNATEDISFEIISSNLTDKDYSVVDDEGNIIDCIVSETSTGYRVNAPSEGYNTGIRYHITIGENESFVAEEFKETKSVYFEVEREDVCEYSYSEMFTK